MSLSVTSLTKARETLIEMEVQQRLSASVPVRYYIDESTYKWLREAEALRTVLGMIDEALALAPPPDHTLPRTASPPSGPVDTLPRSAFSPESQP